MSDARDGRRRAVVAGHVIDDRKVELRPIGCRIREVREVLRAVLLYREPALGGCRADLGAQDHIFPTGEAAAGGGTYNIVSVSRLGSGSV